MQSIFTDHFILIYYKIIIQDTLYEEEKGDESYLQKHILTLKINNYLLFKFLLFLTDPFALKSNC